MVLRARQVLVEGTDAMREAAAAILQMAAHSDTQKGPVLWAGAAEPLVELLANSAASAVREQAALAVRKSSARVCGCFTRHEVAREASHCESGSGNWWCTSSALERLGFRPC